MTDAADMRNQTAIVSAADAGFFPLLQQLVDSIAAHGPVGSVGLCVLDLGLAPDQRQWLEQRAVCLVTPAWDFDFPGRNAKPGHFRAMTARPFLPRYFPGYQTYVWIDADAWVQDWSAVDNVVSAAADGGCAIVEEHYRQWFPWYGRPYIQVYRDSCGDQETAQMARFPHLNTGVFAMRHDSPGWQFWAKCLGDCLQRCQHHIVEQVAMNLTVFRGGVQVRLMPFTHNWLTCMCMPAYDTQRLRYVEPVVPHEVVGIVHRAYALKRKPVTVSCLDGSTFVTDLSFGGAAGPLASPTDVHNGG